MMSNKIFNYMVCVVACLPLLMAGCAQLGGEAATMALKFTPQDSSTYKVVTETERGIKFEGALTKDSNLKGGSNRSRTEMIFTQQIQSVDDKSNAVAKIIIDGLKYHSVVKGNTTLDFDSSREKDKSNPMAKLIGKSYTIEIAPNGEVVKVIDVKQALAAVKGSSSASKVASRLLSDSAVKKRHGILTLPAADKNKLRKGDNWSSVKSFSFGMMGAKSYERIYTVEEIKDQDDSRVAVVGMNAIPSSETAEQFKEQASIGIFSKMFDNSEIYTGRLKLNLSTGKVEKYTEKLQSNWVAVDPSIKQQADEGPAALKMNAVRFYSLEKID